MDVDKRIEEAKAAYHELVTGNQVRVLVDQNGERIEYTAASIKHLSRYIATLEEEKKGTPKKPMGVYFW